MAAPLSASIQRTSLQALFWGSYVALMLYLSSQVDGYRAAAWFVALQVGAGLWGCSEILRMLAERRGWLGRPALGLAWRIAASVALLAALLHALVYLTISASQHWHWIEWPQGRANYSPRLFFLYWLNSAMPLAIWAAGWVSVQALGRYRQGELSRLRAEAATSALKLDVLRARLNPHFVFNALNNLRALINEDTDRARTLVTQLSNTLRHALDHGDAPTVPLRRELAVIDDYLSIEQVHYEQRLTVERDIEAAALDASLPPMLLQLLVENAIKHGIARTPGGGSLTLSARLEAGQLRLCVSNPGRLQRTERSQGVGLAYLRTRLAQGLPGAHFGLDERDGRVYAQLDIPQ